MNNKAFLKVAMKAAEQAGPIFKKYFGRAQNIKSKNGDFRDLVTDTDKQIENSIRKLILKNFPSHKIIGEEYGSQNLEKNDFVWIIDPIDGTTNYIQGLPICCISIGLWQNNTPLVAVVYNPTLNEIFTAVKGKGAFLNGKKISVSKKSTLNLAFGGFGWGRNIHKAQVNFPRLLPLLHKVRTLGSATLEMCFIAMGVFDFHIQSEISLWDFAASTLIIEEAGGTVTELNGKKLNMQSRSFLASNRKLHPKLLSKLKKTIIY